MNRNMDTDVKCIAQSSSSWRKNLQRIHKSKYRSYHCTFRKGSGYTCWYHRHRKPRTNRNGWYCDRIHNRSRTTHNNHSTSY
ncbi:hypothetical protein HanXRQr2_Chr06g0269071 [Helianthus annuus]|uniref:Uncharacterized protein n=1 Tax=Helianthus annuus TaxID=4232 RepID=A0A9K3IUA5_HELAN|nr:hypothetical protein HanXRQr2_Chr06g0269071 [Helianthus annuus]KAJ0916268.1 hypothetical protein HanPSC8_Chr06g0259711 [Helianthus annuus]